MPCERKEAFVCGAAHVSCVIKSARRGSLGLGEHVKRAELIGQVVKMADAERQASRFRRIVFRLLSVIFGLLVGLGAVQLVMWAAGIEPTRRFAKRYLLDNRSSPSVPYHCYPSNPNGELRRVPDDVGDGWELFDSHIPKRKLPLARLDETPWCMDYRISSQGLRDRVYGPKQPAGKRRIVCVGDSFVFGVGVPPELTMVRSLEQKLGPSVEIVNAGRPGMNFTRELAAVPELLGQLGVSRLIMVFIANDISFGPELSRQELEVYDLINIRDTHFSEDHMDRNWLSYSRLYNGISARRQLARIGRETVDWYNRCYNPKYNAEHLDLLQKQLAKAASLPSCRSVLVLYPLMEGLGPDYPLKAVHARVSEMARKAGLPVLDLAGAFEGLTTSEMWVHSCDHHPNGRAHAIAAEAIAKWLKSNDDELLQLSENGNP